MEKLERGTEERGERRRAIGSEKKGKRRSQKKEKKCCGEKRGGGSKNGAEGVIEKWQMIVRRNERSEEHNLFILYFCSHLLSCWLVHNAEYNSINATTNPFFQLYISSTH